MIIKSILNSLNCCPGTSSNIQTIKDKSKQLDICTQNIAPQIIQSTGTPLEPKPAQPNFICQVVDSKVDPYFQFLKLQREGVEGLKTSPTSTPAEPKGSGFIPESYSSKVDPYYHLIKLKHPELFETRSPIGVMGIVTDLDAWSKLEDVHTKTATKDAQGWMITADIPANQFLKLSELPFVTTLNLPRSIQPA